MVDDTLTETRPTAPRGLPFVKMSGSGNDFIIIDDRDSVWDGREGNLARALCQRRTAIGADGLILIRRSELADARMVYHNADGGEATLCGNGGRCTAWYLVENDLARGPRITLEAGGRVLAAEVEEQIVRLEMAPVSWPVVKSSIEVSAEGLGERLFDGYAITVGVPHFVHLLPPEDLAVLDVLRWGSAIRRADEFDPHGVNVDFVAVSEENDHTLLVRSYERGVEDETLACGTGCTAAALAAVSCRGFQTPVHCRTRGGKTLIVSVEETSSPPGRVMLEGEAERIFQGIVEPGLLPE